jgi:Ca2+-binding RTX toxin-like protein
MASNGSSGFSMGVQDAIDAWFDSQDSTSRGMFELFTDDGAADELTGGSGADKITVGSNDSLRNFSSDDMTF